MKFDNEGYAHGLVRPIEILHMYPLLPYTAKMGLNEMFPYSIKIIAITYSKQSGSIPRNSCVACET